MADHGYEAPTLEVVGSLTELTLDDGSDGALVDKIELP